MTGVAIKLILTVMAVNLESVKAGFGFGDCPDVQFIKTLDINRYQGLWYNVQSDYGTLF